MFTHLSRQQLAIFVVRIGEFHRMLADIFKIVRKAAHTLQFTSQRVPGLPCHRSLVGINYSSLVAFTKLPQICNVSCNFRFLSHRVESVWSLAIVACHRFPVACRRRNSTLSSRPYRTPVSSQGCVISRRRSATTTLHSNLYLPPVVHSS